MSEPDVVRIPERGWRDVTAATWRRLASDENFWRLVDRGILGVSCPSKGKMRLHGVCYVGRALCAGVSLEIHEKIEGALASMLRFATHGVFRVERAPASSSELGNLASLLVHQFLDAVSAYVSAGRGFQYTTATCVGSLVGGRIDITRTIRLHARGLRHMVQYEKNVLTCNTPLNRVLLATLREIERLAFLINIPASDLARSRGLAMLFWECRDAEILFGKRERFLQMARELAKGTQGEPVRDLLALSGVLLAHESFEHSAATISTAPRTWLLNLETLFEAAVRVVLKEICGEKYSVFSGGRVAPRIFDEESGDFRAHPDLVFSTAAGVAAVGDVKYKTWSATASAADVYQLLVHSTSFNSPVCFLVYPSDSFELRYLGKATTGARTWLFSIDVRDLTGDLCRVLSEIGLRRSAANPEAPASLASGLAS